MSLSIVQTVSCDSATSVTYKQISCDSATGVTYKQISCDDARYNMLSKLTLIKYNITLNCGYVRLNISSEKAYEISFYLFPYKICVLVVEQIDGAEVITDSYTYTLNPAKIKPDDYRYNLLKERPEKRFCDNCVYVYLRLTENKICQIMYYQEPYKITILITDTTEEGEIIETDCYIYVDKIQPDDFRYAVLQTIPRKHYNAKLNCGYVYLPIKSEGYYDSVYILSYFCDPYKIVLTHFEYDDEEESKIIETECYTYVEKIQPDDFRYAVLQTIPRKHYNAQLNCGYVYLYIRSEEYYDSVYKLSYFCDPYEIVFTHFEYDDEECDDEWKDEECDDEWKDEECDNEWKDEECDNEWKDEECDDEWEDEECDDEWASECYDTCHDACYDTKQKRIIKSFIYTEDKAKIAYMKESPEYKIIEHVYYN